MDTKKLKQRQLALEMRFKEMERYYRLTLGQAQRRRRCGRVGQHGVPAAADH